jgi:chromosome partitioning protein
MPIIAIANHKGGCAKATTVLNLAVTFAKSGSDVLSIDLDPQDNLSAALGCDLSELEENRRTSHRLMLDEHAEYHRYLMNMRTGLDILPACLDPDAEALLTVKRCHGSFC